MHSYGGDLRRGFQTQHPTLPSPSPQGPAQHTQPVFGTLQLPTCQDTAGAAPDDAVSHLFNHISASVAPVLGQAEPCSSFSTSRMLCSVLNLAGLES